VPRGFRHASARDAPNECRHDMDTILVVEDDPSVQRMLLRTFEPAGFDVAIAGDGAVALETFRVSDDYVTRPFSPRELLARMKAAVRPRSQTTGKCEAVSFDDVETNFTQMVMCRNGMGVPATALELKILRFFGNNEGRVLSRTELLNEAWGYHNYPTTRTVDAHIFGLRKKPGKIPPSRRISETVHKVGYRFVR
jgi:DNA-binding response OmpR family regulator